MVFNFLWRINGNEKKILILLSLIVSKLFSCFYRLGWFNDFGWFWELSLWQRISGFHFLRRCNEFLWLLCWGTSWISCGGWQARCEWKKRELLMEIIIEAECFFITVFFRMHDIREKFGKYGKVFVCKSESRSRFLWGNWKNLKMWEYGKMEWLE